MSPGRRLALASTMVAGIATLLASSLEQRDPDPPPVAVIVDFTLDGPATGLSRELDTRKARLDTLELTGSYDSFEGRALTLDRTRVAFDALGAFEMLVTPKTSDELLEGRATVQITAVLDPGLAANPTAGQFTSLFDDTPTVVTVAGDGVEVLVGAATTPLIYNWNDFAALEDDVDAGLHLRMAAAAFNMLRAVLRAVLAAEDLIADIEDNRETLEGMNLGSSLEVPCDNGPDDGDGASRIIWTGDASGSGEGTIGRGDDFEARYENCRREARGRFFEGNIVATDYMPASGTGLRTFAIDADLRNLFIAEVPIDIETNPSADAPRYDGELSLRYFESPTPP